VPDINKDYEEDLGKNSDENETEVLIGISQKI